jgi:hypothetical protein
LVRCYGVEEGVKPPSVGDDNMVVSFPEVFEEDWPPTAPAIARSESSMLLRFGFAEAY